MITFFAIFLIVVAVIVAFCLAAGWLINRPDTGRRAKPLSIEDQRTVRWAQSLNPKNVSRAGRPPTESSSQPDDPPPATATAATSPGPGRHHADDDGWETITVDLLAPAPHVSRPGPATEQLPVANEGHTGPGRHFEACDGCTVMGCGSGCKCACHWGTPGPVVARADAWYDPAFGFDFAGLLDRADAVLAGVL